MVRNRNKEIRKVRVGDLWDNPANHRVHGDQQKAAMAEILEEVGFCGTALAFEMEGGGLKLIDGHLRKASLDPDDEIEVAIVDLTPEERRKVLATHDAIGAMAGVDHAKLDALIADIQFESPSITAMLSELSEKALADLEEQQGGSGEATEDEAPETPVYPVSRTGDIWILGEHRLLCGDSTKAEDVARVMAGGSADICFTSPPYGAAKVAKLRDHYVRGAAKRESFYDEHEDSPESWLELMAGWYEAAEPHCGLILCNVQMLADNKRHLIKWVNERADAMVDVVIWDKVNAAPQMQENVLSNAFEFVFMFGGNGSRAIPFASFHGTIQNIVRIDPRGKNEFAGVHRAVMPLQLPAWVMGELCVAAKSVYEPFSGSGTTIIAAEQLKRRCFAIEISPQYVDVALERWQRLTSREAILESTGKTFSETARARGIA